MSALKSTGIVVALFFSVHLFGQTSYPTGVYLSQEELLSKIPSEKYDLVITPQNNDYAYTVKSPDKAIKKNIIKRKIWAISDGEDLYVNGYQIEFEPLYLKVLDEGKYLLFIGSMPAADAGAVAFGGGIIAASIAASSRWLYAWNPKTRENYKINKAALETWLEKTPWLLADYQNEAFPKDMDVLIRYASLRNAAYDESEVQD